MATNTTKEAFLEKFLANARSKKIMPYINNKNVLDFGCGRNAWNANTIYRYCKSIEGVEENFSVRSWLGK